MLKRNRSMNASILTTLGGFPTVVVAIFQAQSGWSIDFASGHAAVAHWLRPRAFSMSFECIACPSTMICKTSITRMCLLAAMRTCGMFGWTTKPSHVLTSAKCVFLQLSGVPNARRVASSATAKFTAPSLRSSHRKSSTRRSSNPLEGKARRGP